MNIKPKALEREKKFKVGGIYHIYNRGVEKRDIFVEDKDYFRFIHNLFEFNDVDKAGKFSNKKIESLSVVPRKKITEVLCFVLMPNHYHLILKESTENGIINFMKKLNGGYAKYFNEKYERVGPLFQGRFKAIEVDSEKYLIYLSYYIHLNPIELILPDWKNKGIESLEKVLDFLENYRYSSLLDYIGKKNFPSVIDKDIILEYFKGGSGEYKKFMIEFLNNWSEGEDEIKHLFFD